MRLACACKPHSIRLSAHSCSAAAHGHVLCTGSFFLRISFLVTLYHPELFGEAQTVSIEDVHRAYLAYVCEGPQRHSLA